MKTIRSKIDELYERNYDTKRQLELIRSECKHVKTGRVENYGEVRSSAPAILCVECDEFIKYVE